MNHRPFIIVISLLTAAAIVGGLGSLEWRAVQSPKPHVTQVSPPSSTTPPSTALTSASTSSGLSIPVPALGPGAAEATDGTATATPTIIGVNEPTDVRVTIQITDARLIPGSVNLQRLDSAGKIVAVLGTLNDSGTNGDAIAGDKIYSIRARFTEATTTPVRLQVSWALRGVVRRAASNILIVSTVSLPPDPGAAGKVTLAGIDSDGDGVRDDVQRYIVLTYPDSAKTRAALTQYTRAVQSSLIDSADAAASIQNALGRFHALECLQAIAGRDFLQAAEPALTQQIVNTPARAEAYDAADRHFSGHSYLLTSETLWRAQCTFNPDALPN